MKTTVTELPESRVRVEAEVPPDEITKRVNQTAQTIGRDLRIPGFRKGKVPPPVVIRRVGREAVLDETIRSSLGRWYIAAIDDAGIAPIGDPELNVGDMPAEGQPLSFSIEIGVRPKAELGEYKGLEVPRREASASDEAIDREVDQLRERLARLDTVEEAAENGDFVVMDYKGSIEGAGGERDFFAGGEGRDQLLELGSGQLIPGFEEQLTGAKAGEERTVNVAFPPDYQAEHLAGQDAVFDVTVKEVKRKHLPELDDEFAVEAAGFDSLDELRADIRKRIEEGEERQVDAAFREAVVDAAVDRATIEVPDALVEARARELFEQTVHQLSHQGIGKEQYLQIAQKSEDEIVEEAKPDAEQALKREAVLMAVVEAEGIEVSDDEVLEALEGSGQEGDVSPKKLLERLKSQGRLDSVKQDLAVRKAVDALAEQAKPVPADDAPAEDAEEAVEQPGS